MKSKNQQRKSLGRNQQKDDKTNMKIFNVLKMTVVVDKIDVHISNWINCFKQYATWNTLTKRYTCKNADEIQKGP